MEAVCASVILALLICASSADTVKPYTPNTAFRSSKTKVPQSLSKGTTCGVSAYGPNPGRIVGGEEAKPHAWPWQVLIKCHYANPAGKNFTVCGGSVISDKWIITAAHCVTRDNPDVRRTCQILLGKHNLKTHERTELVANISDYFVHAKFDPVKAYNGYDLALYKLAQRLQFTKAIKPICLPFGLPELPYNKSCYVTGWGLTKYDGKMAGELQQLSMRIKDDKYCVYTERAIGRIICVGQWGGKKDACHGDSGGPFACQEDDQKWYLRGVLSLGPRGCKSVASFTKVTEFEEWITNITDRY